MAVPIAEVVAQQVGAEDQAEAGLTPMVLAEQAHQAKVITAAHRRVGSLDMAQAAEAAKAEPDKTAVRVKLVTAAWAELIVC